VKNIPYSLKLPKRGLKWLSGLVCSGTGRSHFCTNIYLRLLTDIGPWIPHHTTVEVEAIIFRPALACHHNKTTTQVDKHWHSDQCWIHFIINFEVVSCCVDHSASKMPQQPSAVEWNKSLLRKCNTLFERFRIQCILYDIDIQFTQTCLSVYMFIAAPSLHRKFGERKRTPRSWSR
jgi:hypothetical protein